MARINFDFDFSKNWKDRDDFPTKEYSEKRIREDIQLLFDELKAHCNKNLHPAINELYSKVAALGGGGQVEHDVMADNSIDSNNIVDGAIDELKLADGSVTTEKLAPGVAEDIAAGVAEELKGMSTQLTLLTAGKVQLYPSWTAEDIPGISSAADVVLTFDYDLNIPSSTPRNRLLVNCWATRGTGTGNLAQPYKYFRYTHGSNASNTFNIYLENTYDVDSEAAGYNPTYNFYAHYAIYLIDE